MTHPHRKDNRLYTCLLSAMLVLTLVIFAPVQRPAAPGAGVPAEPPATQADA